MPASWSHCGTRSRAASARTDPVLDRLNKERESPTESAAPDSCPRHPCVLDERLSDERAAAIGEEPQPPLLGKLEHATPRGHPTMPCHAYQPSLRIADDLLPEGRIRGPQVTQESQEKRTDVRHHARPRPSTPARRATTLELPTHLTSPPTLGGRFSSSQGAARAVSFERARALARPSTPARRATTLELPTHSTSPPALGGRFSSRQGAA